MANSLIHKESVQFQQWENHKQRLRWTHEIVIPRVEKIDPDSAAIMKTCGSFVYVCQCASCTAKHFAGAHRCRKRFCRECAHQRSLQYVAKMMERIVPLVQEGYSLHMVTFTYRDQNNLAEQVERIKKAWRTLYHDDKILRDLFKSRFVGGFRAFEIKIGKNSGLWHAHQHALVLTPPGQFQKDYEWLKPTWKRLTDGNGSIEIHKVKRRRGQALGILKAVLETCKYIVAPDKETMEMNDEQFAEMYFFLKGFRAVNSWGILRNVVKEAEEEDKKPFDEKKLADFICQLCGGNEAEFKVLWAEALKSQYLFDLSS